ncbi:hypothetical protein ACH47Z_43550 [Streptomyces sp. NPDC020192]|uniref:hypothetical protein n=1 Tax=Streptomyces sp. NPDC020192 TaxID=3365066 RepID=UPI0037A5D0A4
MREASPRESATCQDAPRRRAARGQVALQGVQRRLCLVELGERGEDVFGRHLRLLLVVEAVPVGGRADRVHGV